MHLNYSDEQLCKMVKNPKEQEGAFKVILKMYQEQLYSLIRRMVNSHEDTDDILQNTFLKVYRYIHTFEHKSSLYTWIYRIAINETLGFLEQQKVQKRVQESATRQANESYHYEVQTHNEEKINPITKNGSRIIRLRPLLAMAKGFLLLISIGIYYWSNVTANKKDVEYDISTLSTEEAALWLSEEAIISELDLQLYVDGMTLTELQK
jgi:RNA polymerase sigma factor (sigma-70 family)